MSRRSTGGAGLATEAPRLDGEDEEFEEEHAARDRAITTTAAPAVVTCCLRRSCISGTPFRFYMFSPAAMSAAPDSRSACKPWCASTVWPRYRYQRVNGWSTDGGQKVNMSCPRIRASLAAGVGPEPS